MQKRIAGAQGELTYVMVKQDSTRVNASKLKIVIKVPFQVIARPG